MAAKNLVILLVCSMVFQVVFNHPLDEANINTNEKKETDKICGQNAACGWAVYNKLTRNVDYFMKNTCICEPGKQCIRDEDDISVSAYVYRCQQKTKTS